MEIVVAIIVYREKDKFKEKIIKRILIKGMEALKKSVEVKLKNQMIKTHMYKENLKTRMMGNIKAKMKV